MKEEALTETLLRQFLLGQVDDEERQRIESLFITDSSSRDRILAAEQDLIEEYLDDSLSAADKKRFLLQYADTLLQQRRLRIAKTIQDWTGTGTSVAQSRQVPTSIWTRLRSRFNLKPVVVIPIAVTAAFAIIFAAVWLSRLQRNRGDLAIEQEIARLNAASNSREVLPQVSLRLAPVSLRGGEQPELSKPAGVQIVELRLMSLQKETYSTYRAILRRVGDNRPINIPDLRSEPGKAVPVKLPAHFLTRGAYQIDLSGIAADGSISPAEEYRFTVSE